MTANFWSEIQIPPSLIVLGGVFDWEFLREAVFFAKTTGQTWLKIGSACLLEGFKLIFDFIRF